MSISTFDTEENLIERRVEARLRQMDPRPWMLPLTSEDSAFSGSTGADGDELELEILARMRVRVEHRQALQAQLGGGDDEQW